MNLGKGKAYLDPKQDSREGYHEEKQQVDERHSQSVQLS